MKWMDLTNQKYGRLTVLREVDSIISKSGYKIRMWECLCDCGNTKNVNQNSLRHGNSKSCGCLHKEITISNNKKLKTKHGQSTHPLYDIWRQMNKRCNDSQNSSFDNYGGRGIEVCHRWNENNPKSLDNFIKDMSDSYNPGLTLERIDNNKGYNKNNCKWASYLEQSFNRRKRQGCASKYFGISYNKRLSKWVAEVGDKYLGIFCSENEAMVYRESYIIHNNLPNRRNIND